MSQITFHIESPLEFSLKEESLLDNWLRQVLVQEGGELLELTYILCTDDYLHQINLTYLNHDTLTDIITFDNSDENTEQSKQIEGDIFISIERVRENAKTFQVVFQHEFSRVLVHGVLHLLGYKDKTNEEQKEMRAKEDFYIKQLINLT